MPPQKRKAPQPTKILPSLPVKNSVLRQLGIADNELPHGLARLKYNLLLSPSHKVSPESNICTNSGLDVSHHTKEGLMERLGGIIGSPVAHRRPEPCIGYESTIETFRSMSYLDQIAFVCLAAGFHACQAPDCLQYRRKLERVVPLCQSWPGLRDWVLCITSCSLRAIREEEICRRTRVMLDNESMVEQLRIRIEQEDKKQSDESPENESEYGMSICRQLRGELPWRFRAHLTGCVLLTIPPPTDPIREEGMPGMWFSATFQEAAHVSSVSGSIGGPRPDQTIYSVGLSPVSPRCCPRLPLNF